jgi:hypothetical protein
MLNRLIDKPAPLTRLDDPVDRANRGFQKNNIKTFGQGKSSIMSQVPPINNLCVKLEPTE